MPPCTKVQRVCVLVNDFHNSKGKSNSFFSFFLLFFLFFFFFSSPSPLLLLGRRRSVVLVLVFFLFDFVIFATSTVRHVHLCACAFPDMGRWGYNVQLRPSWFEPHIGLPGPRPGHRFSFSLLLFYFFSPSSFSPSPSPLLLLSFSFSLLLLSSLPLPGGKKEEKKAPRRGGVWGGAPVLKWFPQKAQRKKNTFKRRDKGEIQMKLNNPPAVSSATDSRWRRDVASTVLAVATRARSGARALSFRSGKSLGV